jgi:hypothetical protein
LPVKDARSQSLAAEIIHDNNKMKVPIAFLLVISLRLALAQTATDCPADLVVTDDCTDVVNPIACYNQYRWNARTLSCIDDKTDAERKRKVRDVSAWVDAVCCAWELLLMIRSC